ncbi:MAG: HlyD family efflux transporter periplasmic adaptor subunit [Saprospiraceae bacterium]
MQLQRIPWIYLVALITLLWILPRIKKKVQFSEAFYGIAENQIRNYNRSNDVIIESIRVRLGQNVKTGDTLMTFQAKNLFFKKEDLYSSSRLVDINKKADQFQIKQNIDKWEEQKKIITSTYLVKKNKLLAQKKLSDSLSRLVTNHPTADKKYEMEINALNEMMQVELAELDHKISELQSFFKLSPDLASEKQSNIRTEISRLQEQEKDLTLIADMDGLIGQLDVQRGDPVASYQSLVKIYSSHPNLVTSYISENFIGSVTTTDSVIIESISMPGYQLVGKILNLGARVNALPDRLKKIPEIKAWGREVQIEIPQDNKLIQGEKVKVLFPSLSEDNR